MKERAKTLLKVLLWLLLVAGIGTLLLYLPAKRAFTLAQRTGCQSNMAQLDLALHAHCQGGDRYPPTLTGLSSNDVSPRTFICPGVNWWQKAPHDAALRDMDKYTDYIYIAGQSPGTPGGTPIIICPPENHHGEGGTVLDADHSRRWVPCPEIDRIISNAYANNHTIVVSAALTERTKGRYTSRPGTTAPWNPSPSNATSVTEGPR